MTNGGEIPPVDENVVEARRRAWRLRRAGAKPTSFDLESEREYHRQRARLKKEIRLSVSLYERLGVAAERRGLRLPELADNILDSYLRGRYLDRQAVEQEHSRFRQEAQAKDRLTASLGEKLAEERGRREVAERELEQVREMYLADADRLLGLTEILGMAEPPVLPFLTAGMTQMNEERSDEAGP